LPSTDHDHALALEASEITMLRGVRGKRWGQGVKQTRPMSEGGDSGGNDHPLRPDRLAILERDLKLS
jgi:hypothetical protein